MVSRQLAAELLAMRRVRAWLPLLAFALAVCALYLTAGEGAWVSVWVDAAGSRALGFFPSLPALAHAGLPGVGMVARVALAHTLVFPVLAIAFLAWSGFSPSRSKADVVSLARGASPGALLAARVLGASLALQASYLLLSVGVAAAVAASAGVPVAGAVREALGLLALSAPVCESFVVLCCALYAWERRTYVAAGVLLLATYASMVVQMVLGEGRIFAHMGWWMRLCGTAGAVDAPALLAFSALTTALFGVVAYLGYVRQVRPR